MKLKMTIDECLNFADEWSQGMTIHDGSEGWRVVCMLLAAEVRNLEARNKELELKCAPEQNSVLHYHAKVAELEAENNALKAKVVELEAKRARLREQKPVAWRCWCDSDTVMADKYQMLVNYEPRAHKNRKPLYADPKPAQIPDELIAWANSWQEDDSDMPSYLVGCNDMKHFVKSQLDKIGGV